MYDVAVIGAGPSGLNASRRLAERGLGVVVLEKKSKIGDHVICTGIIGKEAFQKFDLSKDLVLEEIQRIKMISPYSTQINYHHHSAFANVVDRKKFDNYLAEIAQAKGAEIELENHVFDISVKSDCVEISAKVKSEDVKKYTAKVALVATGIDYGLNKKLGLDYPRDFLFGIQAEFEADDFDSTHIFVGNNIAPGAFAWAVPIGGKKVRAGLVTESNPKVCFQNLMKKLNLDQSQNFNKNHVHYRAIAQGLVSKTSGERVLSVGEAAGQVKATSGGGIYFGMLCSEFASQVICKGFEQGSFSSKVLAEYEKLWKRAIQREILVGYYARKLCGKLSDLQIERIFQIARSDGVIPLIKEKGNFDWHGELVMTLLKRIPLLRERKLKAIKS
jgi:digeranylgeranylglycerophospholipid reductase